MGFANYKGGRMQERAIKVHSLEQLMSCLGKDTSPAPKQEPRDGLAMVSGSGLAMI